MLFKAGKDLFSSGSKINYGFLGLVIMTCFFSYNPKTFLQKFFTDVLNKSIPAETLILYFHAKRGFPFQMFSHEPSKYLWSWRIWESTGILDALQNYGCLQAVSSKQRTQQHILTSSSKEKLQTVSHVETIIRLQESFYIQPSVLPWCTSPNSTFSGKLP